MKDPERPILSWEQAWQYIKPQSLVGCTLEIRTYEILSTGREVLRCVIKKVDRRRKPPFITERWRLFEKKSRTWQVFRALPQLLSFEKGMSITGIHIHNGRIVSAAPAINCHVIFYPPNQAPPLYPRKEISLEKMVETITKILRRAAREKASRK